MAPENKKQSFESRYDYEVRKIDVLGVNELKEYRKDLKLRLSNLDTGLNSDLVKLNDGKRKFYLGLRKLVVIPLMHYTKNRLKMINRVVHNGVTTSHAKKFIEVAADVLPMALFQKIYGLSLTQKEAEEQTIDDIKKFIETCRDRQADINGNLKGDKDE